MAQALTKARTFASARCSVPTIQQGSAVNIPSMPDPEYGDKPGRVVNCIDDPILSHAEPPQVGPAPELLAAVRPRVFRQCLYPHEYNREQMIIQGFEFLSSRGLDLNGESSHEAVRAF